MPLRMVWVIDVGIGKVVINSLNQAQTRAERGREATSDLHLYILRPTLVEPRPVYRKQRRVAPAPGVGKP